MFEQIIETIKSITSEQIFGWAGIVFGVITFIAYLGQLRSNRDLKEFITMLKAEKDLENLKKEKDKMENQVKDEIPLLGKIAILKDQSDYYASLIGENYKSYNDTQNKLVQLGQQTTATINENIKNRILKEISPKHRMKQLKSSVVETSIVLFLLIYVTGVIIPKPGDYLIRTTLSIVLLIQIIRFYILNSNSKEDELIKFKLVKTIITTVVTSSAIFLIVILFQMWHDESFTDLGRWLFSILIVLSIIFLIFRNKAYQAIENSLINMKNKAYG